MSAKNKPRRPAPDSATGPEPAEQIDREAMPVGDEEPPRLPFPVVGIGASAGGLESFTAFIEAVPQDSGMAYVFVQHLPPEHESMLVDILSLRTGMQVLQVEDGMRVEPNHLYVIRPGHILTLKDGALHLGQHLGKRYASRPVDDFFKSLAQEQRERGIAIIMSGMGSNGTAGAQAIKAVGGLCVAQDPDTAKFPSMPRHLIDAGYADYILRPADIPEVLRQYAGHPYAKDAGRTAEESARHDVTYLREILAVLRTRTRQDFSGYKKPTLLRRVQRRMGLARITKIGDYTRLLRQNPTEVAALADDLLIHVTGFFRDADAWESLRARVIVPLIAARESDSSVRAWVTACSSGEEAYTLAMLLVEEAERTDKRLDIKVFATDTAERTLAQARNGMYPGGIEAEISPERLERFFQKEDAVYRVSPDLRERVVFAPQNVLQDPPFSRLDIATCRNLLIYLDPQVQHRVLSLLHFGLREGGALLLGTSETVAGHEEWFEPIDKSVRLYRRIGPTRHGSVEFPLPRSLQKSRLHSDLATVEGNAERAPRLSVAQLTHRTLLQAHVPAAVTVDRDHRVVYYHGNMSRYLEQPSGEPTRDLLEIVNSNLRGAVRTALQRAGTQRHRVSVRDGWMEEPGEGRLRLVITASPVGEKEKEAAGYFVVSFEEYKEEVHPAVPGESEAESPELIEELRRVRDELQSTVEELQTSNEELKASHEEVMSINEELQSSNEELETSKEEMQSLNEELATVNSQLQAKMEEHESARNDLTALLSSTDIAVLFLDTRFRIRRYTPPLKELLDVISSDIGRPLADLARKFDDPALDADAQAVLERLIPVEQEVPGHNGRWYVRRVLPYRTADNRIDGVVITFVETTARRIAEAAVRESDERHAFLLKVTDALRSSDDPLVLQAEAMHLLGEHLNASRTYYFLAEPGVDGNWTLIIDAEYRRDSALASFAGRHSVNALGQRLLEGLERGQVVAVGDVGNDARLLPAQLDAYRRIDTVAFINVPVVEQGQLVAGVGAHDNVARKWEPREIELIREVAARTWAAVERARSEADLRVSEDKLRSVFESIDEGYCVIEMIAEGGKYVDWCFVETNPTFDKQIGSGVAGKTAREVTGAATPAGLEEYTSVLESGDPARFEIHDEPTGRWYNVFASRIGDRGSRRLAVILDDVTERKRTEVNHAVLIDVSNQLDTLEDVNDTILRVEGFIARHFSVRHCVVAETENGDAAFAIAGYLTGGNAGSRETHLRDFLSSELLASVNSGKIAVVGDTRTDPRVSARSCASIGIGSFVIVPLLRNGVLRCTLSLFDSNPRDWRDTDVALAAELGTRVWTRVERARAETALRESEARLEVDLADTRQLQQLGASLIRDDNVAQLYQQIVDGACSLVHSEMASLQQYSPEQNALRLLAHSGFAPESAKHWEWVRIDSNTTCSAALRTGERTICPDVQADPALAGTADLDAFRASGIRAVQTTPLVARDGRVIGMISTHWRHPHNPSGSDLRLLELLGRQAADLIERTSSERALRSSEERLRVALATAEDANRTKDDFLATLSHELRTPLSAILIYAQILRMQATAHPEYSDALAAITRSAEAQKQLIDDLLDTSRITSGKLRLELRPTEVVPILQDTMEIVAPTARTKGVALSTRIADKPTHPVVLADPGRLQQVISNLLGNGLKFTPPGGQVTVALSCDDGFVQLDVSDTGKGIDAELLPHVFEPFRQGDSTTTRSHGGLGLGLAICKRLVEQHGGTITAASAGLGQGATFTVRLPLASSDVQAEASKGSLNEGSNGDRRAALQGARVLLVEDDQETRRALTALLTRAGAVVDVADSVPVALKAFENLRPALIVSDIGMPGEDGYSLIRQVREIEERNQISRVPAVAFSAFARDENIAMALAAGFDRHVPKPIAPPQLLNALEQLLSAASRQTPHDAEQ